MDGALGALRGGGVGSGCARVPQLCRNEAQVVPLVRREDGKVHRIHLRDSADGSIMCGERCTRNCIGLHCCDMCVACVGLSQVLQGCCYSVLASLLSL